MAITAVALSPENRTDALRRLGEEQFDILVIGAGVVGAGAALDAASRGLKVEAGGGAPDFASGTSSRSSKLVHGGLRYLKQLNFHLVFEALRERKLILEKLCPHLHARWSSSTLWRSPSSTVPAGRVSVCTTSSVPAAGPRHLRHLSKKATLRSFRLGSRARQGRHRLLRGPARRRPAHDGAFAHRGRVRRRGHVEHPRDLVPARRRHRGRRGRP